MRRHFAIQQALEEIFSEAQEEQKDKEVSEDEDGEDYNPKDDTSSYEENGMPQANTESFGKGWPNYMVFIEFHQQPGENSGTKRHEDDSTANKVFSCPCPGLLVSWSIPILRVSGNTEKMEESR